MLYTSIKLLVWLAVGILVGQAIFITYNWNNYQMNRHSTPNIVCKPQNKPTQVVEVEEVQSTEEQDWLDYKAK